MRIIKGFVCIGCIERNRVLFGKAVNTTRQRYESLQTNGIIPFDTLTHASRAAAELRKRPFESVVIRTLKMQIAETQEDLAKLHKRRNLIVLMYGEMQTSFWGRQSPAHSTTLYASYITTNGLKPFSDFAAAEQCAREVRRQGLSRASIATFRLGPRIAPLRGTRQQRQP